MCKNRILGAAVVVALSLPLGVAQAGSFKNVNATDFPAAVTAADGGAPVLTAGVINATFDAAGDPVAVVDVPTDGIVYAAEIFSGSGPTQIPADDMAAAIYTIDSAITADFIVEYTLAGAKFAGVPKFGISDADGAANGKFDAALSQYSGGADSVKVTYKVVMADGGTELAAGDQIAFAYRLGETTGLATVGSTVTLTVTMIYDGGANDGLNAQPLEELTVATSKTALKTVEISDTSDDSNVKISVGDDSLLFTGGNSGSTSAQIGLLKIIPEDVSEAVMESDGETEFFMGTGGTDVTDAGDGEDAYTDGSTLVITGGQFDASATGGSVTLGTINVSATVDAGTATFDLSAANLADIEDEGDTGVPIMMTVNTSDVINTVEGPPSATLTIDFKNDYVADRVATGDLMQIFQNGTVCTAYNVPDSTANDTVNIRIINDSSISGTLSARMFDGSGTEIGAVTELKSKDDPLAVGETFKIKASTLEAAGFSWTGRALLILTSTLPKLEMMLLIRNKSGGPLTNLSTGASGSSCTSR